MPRSKFQTLTEQMFYTLLCLKDECYGMSSEFDMVAMETVSNQYLGGDTSLACSAETQTEIDRQVVGLVKKQHEKARQIIQENRGKLDELAKFLYEKETITGEEFMEILDKETPVPSITYNA